MLACSRHRHGREVDAGCVPEQDALRLGTVDRGVADHDLESEPVLKGDKTPPDLLRRRAEIEVSSPGADFQLERGAVGVRVKDIAQQAGLAPSSVLYYYPKLDDLLLEVSRGAMERYAERRAEAVRALDSPVDQLSSRGAS
jgi:hypothetical protein